MGGDNLGKIAELPRAAGSDEVAVAGGKVDKAGGDELVGTDEETGGDEVVPTDEVGSSQPVAVSFLDGSLRPSDASRDEAASKLIPSSPNISSSRGTLFPGVVNARRRHSSGAAIYVFNITIYEEIHDMTYCSNRVGTSRRREGFGTSRAHAPLARS